MILCNFDCCCRIIFGVGHLGNRFVFFVLEISSLRNQILYYTLNTSYFTIQKAFKDWTSSTSFSDTFYDTYDMENFARLRSYDDIGWTFENRTYK